jgi:acyl carrier protein
MNIRVTPYIYREREKSVESTYIPVRVANSSQSGVVLVAEVEASVAAPWEAFRNRAFWTALHRLHVASNDVVLVPSRALPRLPGGAVDAASVVASFATSHAYLRLELRAWVVNRLCQVLYLAPSDVDVGQGWARYGVDSAVALELIADLEDRVGVRLPAAIVERKSTTEVVDSAATKIIEQQDSLPWWRSQGTRTRSM